MKQIPTLLFTLFTLNASQTVASSGPLFEVSSSGMPTNLSFTLCLNGKGPATCQNYTATARNLSIRTTTPNHSYPSVGIKLNTPGLTVSGCTPIANGYCLFSANNTTPTSIVVNNTTLTSNVSYLALSVNCPTSGGNCAYSNAALTGNARQITITNNGSTAARNIAVVPAGFPSGTTISNSTCSGSLDAGSSCTITLTPGQEASSACTDGSAPTNGTVTVSSDDAPSIVVDVLVLSYGCQYQSGLLYSVDDSDPQSNSIGGKVAALTDQSGGVIWSSNSSGVYDNGVSIYGISQTSTTITANPYVGDSFSTVLVTGQHKCNGATDGACDTNNIVVYYDSLTPPINLSFYAAGLCKASIGGYSDWYLPAICEEGYATLNSDSGSGCGSIDSPTLQNMQSNLVNNNIPGSPEEDHWSSTENSTDPVNGAWRQYFNLGGDVQGVVGKDDLKRVRCSRAITP